MIAIIDYKAGNLTSMRMAFEAIGIEAIVTRSAQEILDCERVVFPGVGAAGAAMRSLAELGLVVVIRQAVARGVPFLGVCLGAQIILDRTQEDGGVSCLGLIPGVVRLFRPVSRNDKVPHMGWNSVTPRVLAEYGGRPHPLFEGIEPGSEFYFVHSYYPVPASADCVLGETDYAGIVFASALGMGNIVATQFHPEKSGRIGLRLLENFCRWTPAAAPGGECECRERPC